MHTLNCYLLAEQGRPVLVGGTPGGDQQPQINVQMLVGLIDHRLDPQSVVEGPRWFSFPGTDPANLDKPGALRLESRFPAATVEGLERRGHPLTLLGPWSAGGTVQLIALDHERGTLLGATDPRAEGVALGL
jgi:gamma-glutamyltranspeptidase/glutathione hydrolase